MWYLVGWWDGMHPDPQKGHPAEDAAGKYRASERHGLRRPLHEKPSTRFLTLRLLFDDSGTVPPAFVWGRGVGTRGMVFRAVGGCCRR